LEFGWRLLVRRLGVVIKSSDAIRTGYYFSADAKCMSRGPLRL